jgi:hypothetical protein
MRETANSPTRIRLDLELTGMPVEGRLAPEGGAEHSFTGYAGLIAALESIRAGGGAGDADERWEGEER